MNLDQSGTNIQILLESNAGHVTHFLKDCNFTIVLPGDLTIKSVQFLFIKGKLNLEENHQRSFTVISAC